MIIILYSFDVLDEKAAMNVCTKFTRRHLIEVGSKIASLSLQLYYKRMCFAVNYAKFLLRAIFYKTNANGCFCMKYSIIITTVVNDVIKDWRHLWIHVIHNDVITKVKISYFTFCFFLKKMKHKFAKESNDNLAERNHIDKH